MISIRLCYTATRKLAWSAQKAAAPFARLDFSSGSFVPPNSPVAAPTRPLSAEAGIFNGRYNDRFETAAGELTDGLIVVTIHDLTDPADPRCLGESIYECLNGSTLQDYAGLSNF